MAICQILGINPPADAAAERSQKACPPTGWFSHTPDDQTSTPPAVSQTDARTGGGTAPAAARRIGKAELSQITRCAGVRLSRERKSPLRPTIDLRPSPCVRRIAWPMSFGRPNAHPGRPHPAPFAPGTPKKASLSRATRAIVLPPHRPTRAPPCPHTCAISSHESALIRQIRHRS